MRKASASVLLTHLAILERMEEETRRLSSGRVRWSQLMASVYWWWWWSRAASSILPHVTGVSAPYGLHSLDS